jgi:spore cortex biosynthesis protein YabQ
MIGGLAVGLLFDLFRLSRKYIHTKDFITYVEDIVFWILVGIIVLVTVYYSNHGEIRGYVFLGLILGSLLYFLTLSKIVSQALTFIINVLIDWARVLIRIISFPINIIMNLSTKIAKKIYKLLDALILGRILNIIKKNKNFIRSRIFKSSVESNNIHKN